MNTVKPEKGTRTSFRSRMEEQKCRKFRGKKSTARSNATRRKQLVFIKELGESRQHPTNQKECSAEATQQINKKIDKKPAEPHFLSASS